MMWMAQRAQNPHHLQKALSAKTRDQELATSQLFSTIGTDRPALLYRTAYNVRTTQIFYSTILYCSQILELCKRSMTIGSFIETNATNPLLHGKNFQKRRQHTPRRPPNLIPTISIEIHRTHPPRTQPLLRMSNCRIRKHL